MWHWQRPLLRTAECLGTVGMGTARQLVRGALQAQMNPDVLQITPATTCGFPFVGCVPDSFNGEICAREHWRLASSELFGAPKAGDHRDTEQVFAGSVGIGGNLSKPFPEVGFGRFEVFLVLD